MSNFTYCNHGHPCAVCGSHEDCRASSDGLRFCKRRHAGDWAPGNTYVGESRDGLWGMWRDELDPGSRHHHGHGPASTRPTKDLGAEQRARRRAAYLFASGRDRSLPLDDASAIRLARSLGLPASLLKAQWRCFKPDHDGQTFVLPEYNFDATGDLRPVCYLWRELDGTKRNHGDPDAPVKRGLNMAKGWESLAGPIYLPEGASDTMALHAMGLCAWGRPSSRAGVEAVAELLARNPDLAGRDLVVLGENDERPDGRWEGRDGAHAFARGLAERTGRAVRVAMPPPGVKDVREWFKANWRAGSDPRRLGGAFALATGFRRVFRPACAQPPPPTDSEAEVRGVALAMAALVAHGRERLAGEDARAQANVARSVAALRACQQQYDCPDCRPILMRSAEGTPHVVWARCQKWTCPGCRRWLILREMAATAFHLARSERLFEGAVSPGNWPALRKRLSRAGAEHRKVLQPDGRWYVVADAHADGLVPVSADVAIGEFDALLNEYRGDVRPVTSSRGWALLKEQGRLELTRVGMCESTLTPRRAAEIARGLGAEPTPLSGRSDRPSHVVHVWRLDRPGGWDDRTLKRLSQALYDGELRPVITTLTEDPDNQLAFTITTVAEDIAMAV